MSILILCVNVKQQTNNLGVHDQAMEYIVDLKQSLKSNDNVIVWKKVMTISNQRTHLMYVVVHNDSK